MLFLIALILFLLTFHKARPHYHHFFIPNHSFLSHATLSSIVVSFWAYAGFENLTFMSSEFKNLKKDFRRSILIALLICGVTYGVLSLNYAAIFPKNIINIQLGLFQLSTATQSSFLTKIITLFAFIAVQN